MNTVKLYTYDGDQIAPITKATAREWVRRVRADLRDIELALLRLDFEGLQRAASDAAGSAAELQTIAEATLYVGEGVTR